MRILGSARRTRQAIVLAAAGALTVALVPLPGSAQAATSEGVDCETSASATFDLSTEAGYVFTPDGNSIYTWSYAVDGKSFQLPGPTLCVQAGDRVTVRLRNTLREPVSIVFPGQTGVLADGVPSQPVLGATAADPITSLAPPAAARVGTTDGRVTYTFTATEPGTYLYESGTDQQKQVQMGLYGALIVRPAGFPDRAYAGVDSRFNPDKEYLHLLSEIDPALHLAVERNRPFNFANYKPRYFLINGRSMPDTIAPNRAPWLPAQPYGATVHIKPYDPNTNAEPALLRYINISTQTYPFHPHGNDQRVVGRDGRALKGSLQEDLSYEKFLIDVGPGQTVDTTLTWTDAEHWDPVTNPIPPSVQLPPLADQLVSPDSWFSESPYLGSTGELPAGVTSFNECGEYYHTAHSHALQQSTNYGASFGGMMTLIRIDPPAGCPTAP